VPLGEAAALTAAAATVPRNPTVFASIADVPSVDPLPPQAVSTAHEIRSATLFNLVVLRISTSFDIQLSIANGFRGHKWPAQQILRLIARICDRRRTYPAPN
jgi:hypothetical protein